MTDETTAALTPEMLVDHWQGHPGHGYVYLRLLDVEPPAFYER